MRRFMFSISRKPELLMCDPGSPRGCHYNLKAFANLIRPGLLLGGIVV